MKLSSLNQLRRHVLRSKRWDLYLSSKFQTQRLPSHGISRLHSREICHESFKYPKFLASNQFDFRSRLRIIAKPSLSRFRDRTSRRRFPSQFPSLGKKVTRDEEIHEVVILDTHHLLIQEVVEDVILPVDSHLQATKTHLYLQAQTPDEVCGEPGVMAQAGVDIALRQFTHEPSSLAHGHRRYHVPPGI